MYAVKYLVSRLRMGHFFKVTSFFFSEKLGGGGKEVLFLNKGSYVHTGNESSSLLKGKEVCLFIE